MSARTLNAIRYQIMFVKSRNHVLSILLNFTIFVELETCSADEMRACQLCSIPYERQTNWTFVFRNFIGHSEWKPRWNGIDFPQTFFTLEICCIRCSAKWTFYSGGFVGWGSIILYWLLNIFEKYFIFSPSVVK